MPHIGHGYARRSTGRAVGGDVTFSIDEFAEERLLETIEAHGDIAYYSEDKGLVSFGNPSNILIVDPIDGTRPAAAGLESCCVSIGVTDKLENPKIGDIKYGIVQEIKSGKKFTAKKGEGYLIDNELPSDISRPSINKKIEHLFWTIGFRGRPAKEQVEVLGELIDISSVGGSVFDIGSACFAILRVAEGHFDAYVDVGHRMIEDVPRVRKRFLEVGNNSILNNSPYDIVAAKLIAEEAGCIVTDAYGDSLDDRPLLGSTHEFQVSSVISCNLEVHNKILETINEGISRLKVSC